jgi:hypothetical protein
MIVKMMLLTNYFSRLSREEKEQNELANHQQVRLRREARVAQQLEDAKEDEQRQVERNRIASQVIEIIDLDDSRDVGDQVRNTFEEMMTNEVHVTTSQNQTIVKTKRKYGTRPDNWKEIAHDFMVYKNQTKTMIKFGLAIDSNDEVEQEKHQNYWRSTLNKWKKEWPSAHKFDKDGKFPVYGKAIDNELANVVRNYNRNGVPMTNFVLRCCLMDILVKKLPDLIPKVVSLSQTAGKYQYKFGRSWANRFWKRHDLRSRIATTKMRSDLPADYQTKKELFENLLSVAINKFNVPDELIIGLDETNTQFVPQVKKTRVPKGIRKVRVIGVGHEKPQITVTIALAATGHVVDPTQDIFGGKTNRSLPNQGRTPPPPDQYFDKTSSHWQTPQSFIIYITKVLIPYRLQKNREMELPDDQKMIVILDLHYSHKDPAVLALLKANHMIPIFVPAGCTDAHQVRDVVANKPYKNGVSAAFIAYASGQFEEWNRTRTDDDDCFRMNLSIGVMKPVIQNFVSSGINALKTPEMTAAIKKCFYEQGLVGTAKTAATYARALAASVEDEDGEPVVVPTDIEEEENVGQVTEETEAAGETVEVSEVVVDNFIIEVGTPDTMADSGNESDLSDHSESGSDESDSDSEVPHANATSPEPAVKRVRKSNTMVGSVRGGKYSKRK